MLGRVSPRALLACGALALFGGCASEPDSHVVSAPPPPAPATVVNGTANTTVTTQTTSAPMGQPAAPATIVTTTQAPPTAQAEVVLAQPGPDYKWVPGYWTWRDSRYEWMAGHWELPPHSDAVWVAPHYEPEASGGYRYYEGYWN